MAVAGQRDNNILLPPHSSEIDKRPWWREERIRIIKYVADTIMAQMSDEEKERRARGSISERLLYAPDHELISRYENLGGEWTERMKDKYRG